MTPDASLRVVVASANPVKIRAALGGFRVMFPEHVIRGQGVAVSSAVRAQPSTDAETLCGAEARADRVRELVPAADFWVGIEGGIAETADGMAAYAWVVARSEDRRGKARTCTFFLPEAVASLVRAGHELGEADDRIFGCTDSKRETGAVGLLTGGAVDREALYRQAVALALIPFRHPHLYS